jgi:hypothetical protein
MSLNIFQILDPNHHLTYLTSGTGEVRIDDFVRVWIQIDKHFQYKLPCRLCVLLRP